ncbi:MAG: GxxExxY protein, partial [Burkholderiales bacterium]
MDEELAAGVVVDAAIKVHSALGPGLLESAYQTCLEYELLRRNLRIRKQVALPVHYADVVLDVGYRLDLVVE